MDDQHHPAFSMANALLSDDERDAAGMLPGAGAVPGALEAADCLLCGEARADTACLPCGCVRMCRVCALRVKVQNVEGRCPFCARGVDDYAVVG
jgi:hypothetical protein